MKVGAPIRVCRACGATSTEARFTRRHRCAGCDAAEKAGRSARIRARGPRTAAPERRDAGECPEHLAWVRSLPCAVPGCRGAAVAHHVRAGTGGGTGLKPSDRWAVPLCDRHHREGHDAGWRTFEARYGVDLRFMATDLAARSPHLAPSAQPPDD